MRGRQGQRRRPWQNELSTLPKYERLLEGVRGLDEPVRTAELQSFAGLGSDLNGTLGALFMLEAVGHVHPVRGSRRQLIWHPRRRTGERPEKLENLLPYQRIPKLLRHFGRTTIGTRLIMLDVHFTPEGKHGRHERILGALKVLVGLGIAAYDDEDSGWYYASANGLRRPYKTTVFGPWSPEGPVVYSIDDPRPSPSADDPTASSAKPAKSG
jgi:hypothetical protein